MTIRALIADDHPLAIERLKALLAVQPDIEVVGTAGSGPDAAVAVERLQPDLLFLDLQMPGCDGFEVLARLGAGRLPLTVFVTAYDQHALRAFEVHAFDYLLKPFGRLRLERTLDRARRQMALERDGASARRLMTMVDELRSGAGGSPRLLVRAGGRVLSLPVERIDWVEAAGNYSVLHAGSEAWRVRATLTSLETRLEPLGFARVHRSRLVNVAQIREIRVALGGGHEVALQSGQCLGLTRGHREALERRLADGP